MAAAGLLALVSAFLPWWAVRSRVGDVDGGLHDEVRHGMAWETSTRWTEAVLVTVAAAAVWLLWRWLRGSVPWPVRLVLVAGVVLALYVSLQQREDVEAWPPPGARFITSVCLGDQSGGPSGAEEIAEPFMERDHLRSYHDPALHADISWGFWAGIGAMVLVGVALVTAGPPGRDRGADEGA